ncbi:MAG: hypothetical protein AB7F22_31940 [Reyranella sp.]
MERDPDVGESASAEGSRRFVPDDPVSVIRSELDRHSPETILVLGGRAGIWEALAGRAGIIAYGTDARSAGSRAAPGLTFIDEVDASALLDEELSGGDGEGREVAIGGATLGMQIGLVLEALYRLGPDPDDR